MLQNKTSILKQDNNKAILVDITFNTKLTHQPVVVFCHGYKGFKDWGAWPIMAKHIANAGYCFVKFNFSHNGTTIEQPNNFADLEAFGQNNYTKELHDLNSVLNWVEAYFKTNAAVNANHITLIGHSRGGGISIIKASEDKRIKKLITLASVCDFAKRTANIANLQRWENEGVIYILNGRTKQQMPHYYQFYTNFITHKNRLNIENAARKIVIPFLIIHGDADKAVNILEGENLHRWCKTSTFKRIKNADHVFNIKHPWEKDNVSTAFNNVITTVINFLNA